MVVAESAPNALSGCMFLQCVEKVPAPGATPRAWGYLTNLAFYRREGFRSVSEVHAAANDDEPPLELVFAIPVATE